jgi:hypothetical protein
MKPDEKLAMVAELKALIKKGNAHVSFEDALSGLPAGLRTERPGDLPYSIWQLVEHMRIAQRDIVDFCISADYQHLKWPDDYWTANTKDIDDDTWAQALKQIESDRNRFFDLLDNKRAELFEAFAWGEGQNLFREAVLIADHNAYHTAEIVVIRRLLKCWN